MPSLGQNAHDDRLVIQYLLGSTSGEETDRMDELSVTDDDFASRLRSAENDLVDSYVTGQLEGETLQRFESFYLASPGRLEKVRFAEAFARVTDRPAAAQVTSRRQWTLTWTFAAAAALLLVAALYLLQQNRRIQQELAEQTARTVALEKRAQALQQQLDASATSPPQVPVAAPSPVILAFELSPQTRGPGSVAAVSLPAGIDVVAFQLRLESDDFPVYRAALRDPAVNQIIWQGGGLKAQSNGDNRFVTADAPRALLKQKNYILELTGIAAGGKEELVNSYVFRVVTK